MTSTVLMQMNTSEMCTGKLLNNLEANLLMMSLGGISKEECIRRYRRGSNLLSNLEYLPNPKTPSFSPRLSALAQLWPKEAKQTRIAL